MLGTAAQGSMETALGPWAAMSRPAEKRAGAACRDLAKLEDMVRARVHDQADQAAWAILQRSVSRALEYDIRICPWEYVAAHAERLAAASHSTLEMLLTGPLDDAARAQAQLPGALGGLSLGLPTRERAASVFLATHVARGHAAALMSAGRAGSTAAAPTRRPRGARPACSGQRA